MDSETTNVEIRQVEILSAGKVVIHAAASSLTLTDSMSDHNTCIGSLSNHCVLASFDVAQLPVAPKTKIAEFSLGEAHCISNDLRRSCFVFVSKSSESQPKYGFMLKNEDWQKVLRRREQARVEHDHDVKTERDYFPAVMIDLRREPEFSTVCVNADAIAKWDNVLFNVGRWLRDVWSISGTWIKPKELELNALKFNDEFVPHTDHVYNFGSEFQLPLLVSFLFNYWEAANLFNKERSWELATILNLGEDQAFNDQKMHRIQAAATCINPPPDTAKEAYGALRRAINRDYRPAAPTTIRLDPENLCWLLAVRFPVEFARALAANKAISDLTGSRGKKVQVEIPILKSRQN